MCKIAPLIQAENSSEQTKQPKPFARDKDPLYLHSLSYSSYTVHNGKSGTKVWNKKFICCISRPFKKQKANRSMGKDTAHMTFRT